jgi:hypothetical protein
MAVLVAAEPNGWTHMTFVPLAGSIRHTPAAHPAEYLWQVANA